jgi:CDP-glucose 4,6-dehydratase
MMAFDDIYRGRRVLVTGHTGFKGSWLSLWLDCLGAEVGGYSLYVPTEPSNFTVISLEHRLRHFVGDIRDRAAFEKVVDEFRPSVIFHLAAQPLVRRSYSDPAVTFETNTMGMVTVLECARKREWIECVVLITSDKVYRNKEWCWGYRETDELGGHDPYSGSKGCAELVAHSYFHSYMRLGSTRMAIGRAGNVIGGGDWAEDRIVPDCIRAWSVNTQVSIRSPRATRPWQHVLEPLSGYLWLGAKLLGAGSGLSGEAFNFGPDGAGEHAVEDLIQAMASRWTGAGWSIPAGFEQVGHEATLLRLSCEKALTQLDWHAVLRFEDTVDLTVKWYRQWQDGSKPMDAFTVEQIEQYCEFARRRGAAWISQ